MKCGDKHVKSSALCGTAAVKKKRGFRFCSRHMQVYKLEGLSRDFGFYNHSKLKYSKNILLCYWFTGFQFFYGEIVFIFIELSL